MSYFDGYVVPVPKDKKDAYLKACSQAGKVFLENGATRVVESWGDDVPDGKVTDFRRSVQAESSENVVFSFVEWPSKAVRDTGMKKAMEDPRMANMEMPIDGKRMIFGGFAPLYDSKG